MKNKMQISKRNIKLMIDILMIVFMLLLMGYSRFGELTHELIGTFMLFLVILHLALNSKWYMSVFKGKYTTYRTFQIVLVALCSVSMLGSIISGILLSKSIYNFLNIGIGSSLVRSVHMLCTHWSFLFMALHFGINCHVVFGRLRQILIEKQNHIIWLIRIVVLFITFYGAYAFFNRNYLTYLFQKNTFVFIDLKELKVLFILDFLCIYVLFTTIGYYLLWGLQSLKKALIHANKGNDSMGKY